MKESSKLAIVIASTLTAVITLAGLTFISTQKSTKSVGGLEYNYLPQKPLNNYNISCGTGSTLLAATTTSRQYMAISNDSANKVYISLGTPAATGTGILLQANAPMNYELANFNMYLGAIYCIAPAGASSVAVTEAK